MITYMKYKKIIWIKIINQLPIIDFTKITRLKLIREQALKLDKFIKMMYIGINTSQIYFREIENLDFKKEWKISLFFYFIL